jgi:hypothetical protein
VLSLSLSLDATNAEEEEGARFDERALLCLSQKRVFWGKFRSNFLHFFALFPIYFFKEAENVSKHRLDDARVHRRVHIPGPLGGVLSDWCVLLFFFCP